jgi:deoxycytidylate deaminase
MDTYADVIFHIKRAFVIVGLTGYTGSGCSTAASILDSEAKPQLPGEVKDNGSKEHRRHLKLRNVWNNLPWERFTQIEVSKIIFLFALMKAYEGGYNDKRLENLKSLADTKDINIDCIKKIFATNAIIDDKDTAKEIVRTYNDVKLLYAPFKKSLDYSLEKFIALMQDYGDQIRKYGTLAVEGIQLCEAPSNILIIPESIQRLIKCIQIAENKNRFVIDAFRNPFEVEYFRRRYNEFYLVAVQRDKAGKQHALQGLSTEALDHLEKRERGKSANKQSASDQIASLNVADCLQKAEYFIHNAEDSTSTRPALRFGLIKLLCLIQHPGCISPNQDERSMQLAISARQNSGCLSRHVGAAVVSKYGLVLGVGWNDPPRGQIPCSLRSTDDLLLTLDCKVYSKYETREPFIGHIKLKPDHAQPYCFKDELSVIENKKSNEFTRSLHAEENALLQAQLYGIEAVKDATLYTTASTCTLCAKKAYHLGISRIVYIDEYPGIAIEQTLKVGETQIMIEAFVGVTSSAYFKLFEPLVNEKDLMNLYR